MHRNDRYIFKRAGTTLYAVNTRLYERQPYFPSTTLYVMVKENREKVER